MIRKTLVVAAATAAAALAFAPAAQASPAPVDVTDQFVAFNAPEAFAAKGNLNLLFSNYGTTGRIECAKDGVALVACVQIDPWGARHNMQYITNAGPRGIWATLDGWQVPQLPPLPQLPEFHLPPMGPIVIPPMPDLGSVGSSGPGLNVDIDVTSSLGGLGVGVGAGSS